MEELSKSLKRRKSLSASVRSIRIYSAMTMMDESEHYYIFALVVGISIHQNQSFFFIPEGFAAYIPMIFIATSFLLHLPK